MAGNSTLYRGRIQLSDIDSGRYESLELSLALHPSETLQRLVARALAYAIRYREDLVFSKGICEGDTPDIMLQPPGQKMQLWIEVGEPSAERLLEACRKADRVELFLYGRQPWRWEKSHGEKLHGRDNLRITPLPYEVLDRLAQQLPRSFDWTLTISDGHAYLDTGGETLEFEIPLD